VAVGADASAIAAAPPSPGSFVSPRREGSNGGGPPADLPHIAPPEPIPTYIGTPGAIADPGDDTPDEPPVPDEARARIVGDAMADQPLAAGPGAVLHVKFEGTAGPDRLVRAMETVKVLLRDRPGGTRVVLHVPAPSGGDALPMELRWGVAYDAELLAEVRRQLGDGLVELRLAST
jgi:hypothetical protein